MLDATPIVDSALVEKLRRSLRLQDPLIETDPVYQYDDFSLWEVIQDSVVKFDINEDITTLDPKYYAFINNLATREILWRLAIDTAPYYRLEAEGAVLEKNMRFDHYYKLVRLVDKEYENLLAAIGGVGNVEVIEVTTKQKHNTVYNYEHSIKPTISLTLSEITATSVNLDWTKFAVKNGRFYAYKLYIKTSAIVDPYAIPEIPVDADFVQLDIHKLKHRFTNLTPNTLYYVAVVSMDTNGIYGYAETCFTTLPAS